MKNKRKERDYYKEIDKAIESYEDLKPWHDKTTDWICNRIAWCWRFRKITEAQMVELSGRITAILEMGLN